MESVDGKGQQLVAYHSITVYNTASTSCFRPYFPPHVRSPVHHHLVVPIGQWPPPACCPRCCSCSPLPPGVLLPPVVLVIRILPVVPIPTWRAASSRRSPRPFPTVTFTRLTQLCGPSILLILGGQRMIDLKWSRLGCGYSSSSGPSPSEGAEEYSPLRPCLNRSFDRLRVRAPSCFIVGPTLVLSDMDFLTRIVLICCGYIRMV